MLVPASVVASLCAALPQLAFVPIVAGDAPPTTAARIHDALEAAVAARPLLVDLLSYNELLVQSAAVSASRVRECGGNAACVAEVFEGRGLQVIVVATVNFELEPWSAALTVIDPETLRSRDRVVPLPAADGPTVAGAIAAAAAALLADHGVSRGGRGRVEVRPRDARVYVPDALEPIGPLRYLGPPGEYALRAELEGYTPAQSTLRIVAGEESVAQLTLPREQTSVLDAPWFWVVSGVAAAAVIGGVTAGVLLSGRDDPAELCFSTAGRGCP